VAGAGAGVAGTAAGDDVVGAEAAKAGAGAEAVGVAEGITGAGDWALAVIQFHQPNGQEAASAGAEAPISSPPARVRVITEAVICFLFFSTRRTVPTAYATPHIE
jgi:hypothetical protein